MLQGKSLLRLFTHKSGYWFLSNCFLSVASLRVRSMEAATLPDITQCEYIMYLPLDYMNGYFGDYERIQELLSRTHRHAFSGFKSLASMLCSQSSPAARVDVLNRTRSHQTLCNAIRRPPTTALLKLHCLPASVHVT